MEAYALTTQFVKTAGMAGYIQNFKGGRMLEFKGISRGEVGWDRRMLAFTEKETQVDLYQVSL